MSNREKVPRHTTEFVVFKGANRLFINCIGCIGVFLQAVKMFFLNFCTEHRFE